MANISAYLEKAILDWTLGGAAATQPPSRFVGLAVGTPTSVGSAAAAAGSEMGTISGYTRLSASFAAAASPAGSVSNNAAMTFGPFSSVGSVVGAHIWDAGGAGSSNMLYYGVLQTARTFAPGDSLIFAAGALNITLN